MAISLDISPCLFLCVCLQQLLKAQNELKVAMLSNIDSRPVLRSQVMDTVLYNVNRISGVTTDPADPAMWGGGHGPWGPKNYGINFFHWKFQRTNTDIRCDEQISVHILVHAVSVRFSLPFFLFLVILNLHVIPALLTSLFILLTSGAYRPLRPYASLFTGPSLDPSLYFLISLPSP